MRRDDIPQPDDVLANAGFVRGIARAVLGGDDRVEDVVQDTWLVATRTGPRREGALRAWLAVVARNLSYRVLRGSARRRTHERRAAREEQTPDVAAIAEREELRRRLVAALLALEEPYRATLLLRYYEALSVPEVALRLGVPIETARTRLRRGLARLRECLDEEHRGDRRAWAIGLLPTARGPEPSRWTKLAEMLVTKKPIAGVAALLFLGWLGWTVLRPGAPPDEAPGRGTPTAQAPDLRDPGAELAAHAVPTRVRASAAAEATGHVVDTAGRPIPGVRVLAWRDDVDAVVELVERNDGPVRSTRTDASGAFRVRLEGRAPAFTLLATAPDFAPTSLGGIEAGDDVTICLLAGESLHGTVRDFDEHPVARARITWTGFTGNARSTVTAVSEADGTYRIAGLSGPSDFFGRLQESLEVTAEGFAPVRIPRVRAASTSDGGIEVADHSWDVWLGRGATVRGRVVDAESGRPVARARVVAWSEQEVAGLTVADGNGIQNPAYFAAVGDVTTSEEGAFTIEHVPAWGVHVPGVHTASASQRRLGRVGVAAAGYAIETLELNVPVEAEVVDVELRVTAAGAVRGRVFRTGGVPVVGALLSWKQTANNWTWTWIPPLFPGLDPERSVTDEEGRYLLSAVSARRESAQAIQVIATPPGSAAAWAKRTSVEVTPRAGATVGAPDLTLESDDPEGGMSAMAFVVDEVGAPVAGAAFEGCLPGARTDETGRARLFFYAPRRSPRTRDATVEVRAPGRERVTSPTIALAPSAVPEVHVVLGPRRSPSSAPVPLPPVAVAAESQNYSIEGTVRDARTGRAILKWELSLRGSADIRPTARPIGLGRFRFDGLPAGTWTLDARAEGYDPETREGIRLGPDVVAERVDVRLAAGVVVRGRLLDEAGAQIGAARAFFNGQGTPSLDGEVAPDGRYSVPGFRVGGRYALWVARADGHGGIAYWVPKPYEDIHVPVDARTVEKDLTVTPAGGVQLYVRCRSLGSEDTTPTEAQTEAGAKTKFTFENMATTAVWKSIGVWQRQREDVLPVGRWTVRVDVPDSPAREIEFVVEAGKTTRAVVDVP